MYPEKSVSRSAIHGNNNSIYPPGHEWEQKMENMYGPRFDNVRHILIDIAFLTRIFIQDNIEIQFLHEIPAVKCLILFKS